MAARLPAAGLRADVAAGRHTGRLPAPRRAGRRHPRGLPRRRASTPACTPGWCSGCSRARPHRDHRHLGDLAAGRLVAPARWRAATRRATAPSRRAPRCSSRRWRCSPGSRRRRDRQVHLGDGDGRLQVGRWRLYLASTSSEAVRDRGRHVDSGSAWQVSCAISGDTNLGLAPARRRPHSLRCCSASASCQKAGVAGRRRRRHRRRDRSVDLGSRGVKLARQGAAGAAGDRLPRARRRRPRAAAVALACFSSAPWRRSRSAATFAEKQRLPPRQRP